MQLTNIQKHTDFDLFYAEHNLNTVEQKIAYLRKELKIIVTKCNDDTPSEELLGLEELVLTHLWEGLQ